MRGTDGRDPEPDVVLRSVTQPRLYVLALGVAIGVPLAGAAVALFSLQELDGMSLALAAGAAACLLAARISRSRLVENRPQRLRESARQHPLAFALTAGAALAAFVATVVEVRHFRLGGATPEAMAEHLLGILLGLALAMALWVLFFDLRSQFQGDRP